MLNYAPLDGTSDLFPDDHKYLTFLKKVFRHEFRKSGFRRISTSVLENKEVIAAAFGGNHEFLYETEGGFLRTHSAVGILRAYMNADISEEIQPVYYYFMNNYFYNEGDNYSELFKIGGEIIGENDPILDAILIYVMYAALNKMNLNNTFKIRLNSVGIEKEKIKYREELISFYENKKHLLSEKAKKDLEIDPMLVLLSTEEDDMILAKEAPKMEKFLKKDSKAHYEKVKEYLDVLNVEYIEDHTLVGKYDFNTNTIWEFRTLDTNRRICLGARHNMLSKKLGSLKEIPATGFYINTYMLVQMLKERDVKIKNKDKIDLYFVQLGDEAKKIILPLSIAARDAGINTVVSLGTPSMKEQMLKANRSGAKYVVMVGLMEARRGIFQVRDSVEGTQEEVNTEVLIDYIIKKIGAKSLDFYCPAKDLTND